MVHAFEDMQKFYTVLLFVCYHLLQHASSDEPLMHAEHMSEVFEIFRLFIRRSSEMLKVEKHLAANLWLTTPKDFSVYRPDDSVDKIVQLMDKVDAGKNMGGERCAKLFEKLLQSMQPALDRLIKQMRVTAAKKVKFDNDKENKVNNALGKRSESFEDFFTFEEPVVEKKFGGEKKGYAQTESKQNAEFDPFEEMCGTGNFENRKFTQQPKEQAADLLDMFNDNQ